MDCFIFYILLVYLMAHCSAKTSFLFLNYISFKILLKAFTVLFHVESKKDQRTEDPLVFPM